MTSLLDGNDCEDKTGKKYLTACLVELNPQKITYKRRKMQSAAELIELNFSFVIRNKGTCYIDTITVFRYYYVLGNNFAILRESKHTVSNL